MKIQIETIPHSEHRYSTCGDWYWNDDHSILFIKVSQLSDWRMSVCVAIHEMAEALLCKERRITQEEVDKFDNEWLPHDSLTEPGEDNSAPYKIQHSQATMIERMFCAQLGLTWSEYEEEIDKLFDQGEEE